MQHSYTGIHLYIEWYIKSKHINQRYNMEADFPLGPSKLALLQLAKATVTSIKKQLEQLNTHFEYYSNDRVKQMAQVIIRFRSNYHQLLSELKSKTKQIILPSDLSDWEEAFREYVEGMETEAITDSFGIFRNAFFKYLRSLTIKQIAGLVDLQQSAKSPLELLVEKSTLQAIKQAVSDIQINQKIVFHILLRAYILQQMTRILRRNSLILDKDIDTYHFGEKEKPIIHLHRSLKRQFKQFAAASSKVVNSVFENFASNREIEELNADIEKYMAIQNQQSLMKIRELLKKLYQLSSDNVISEVCNNLAKTFRLQINQATFENRQKYMKALTEVHNFTFTFSFTRKSDVFIKGYKVWWRGKQQKQNTLMYTKHWHFINYFMLTLPPGIVQYSNAIEQQKEKSMRFMMEKGEVSFNNFESGYQYFHSLQLRDKIKFILDLAESLIVLEQHGINHYDITMRNTVMAGKKWKLIDFDVARMVDSEFDYSDYSSSDTIEIRRLRSQIIKVTQQLMRKELKEEKIITKTDPGKATTPIENINRLSQYYNLPNQISFYKSLKQKENGSHTLRSKFTKGQRLNMIYQYEKLIVGKRDCNKYAFMILKLFYKSKEKLFQQHLILAVQEFIKEFREKRENTDFWKYADRFEIDKNVAKTVNVELIRLLSELFIPEVERRIPMRLFYLKLIQLLKINQYPVISRPLLPKQSLPRKYNESLVNINGLLDPQANNTNRRQEIMQVERVFKDTVRIAFQHFKQCINIYASLFISLGDIEQFRIASFDKKSEENMQKFVESLKAWGQRRTQVVKYVWNNIKERKDLMHCYIHKRVIEAQCLQPNCTQRWLCSACLEQIYCTPDINQFKSKHSRLIKVSALKSITQHHKFSHYHKPNNKKKELVCQLKRDDESEFVCKECLEGNRGLQKYDEIYLINRQANEIYDRLNLSPQKDKYQYLISHSTPPLTFDRVMKIQYTSIYQNFARYSEMTEQQHSKLDAKLEESKETISQWFERVGTLNKQIMEAIYQGSEFKVIEDVLEFLQAEPNLLFQLRKKQGIQLKEYIKRLRLAVIAKIDQSEMDTFVLNSCEYFVDKIKQILQNLCRQMEALMETCRKERTPYIITHRKIFQYFQTTSQMRRQLRPNIKIQKIKPSAKTLFRRQQRKKEKQRQENSSYHKSQPERSQSRCEESQVEIMGNDDYDAKMSKYYEICPCRGSHIETNWKGTTSDYKIIAICTLEQCGHPFVCNQCKKSHQCGIQHLFYLRDLEKNEQRANQIAYFKSYVQQSKIYFKIQKILQKIVSDVEVQMISPINFIESLTESIQDVDQLKRLILKRLSSAALEENNRAFSDTFWIVKNFSEDACHFLDVLFFGAERYVMGLDATTKKMKESYKVLKQINLGSFLDRSLFNSILVNEWFDNKYKVITNSQEKDTPMPFQQISNQHCTRVQELRINGVRDTLNDQADTDIQTKNIERDQFKQKLVKTHYNYFDTHFYWTSFNPYRNGLLSHINKFKNLKVLQIFDCPNMARPAVFKSIHIQSMLKQTSQLKQLTLKCLNGFDSFCLQVLKKKHPSCLTSIDSWSDLVIEHTWINELFSPPSKITLPFQIQGEAFNQFYQNIVQGQFELHFSNDRYKETMVRLQYMRGKIANKLSIRANQLLYDSQAEDGFSFHQVNINFWCRKTFGAEWTQQLVKQINRRYVQMAEIFAPIQQKFENVRFLTLHGLLINGDLDQTAKNPDAQSVQRAVRNYLGSLQQLETLQIVKCFGLSLFVLTKNMILKKLIIEQSVFRAEKIGHDYSFAQLQTLILKRVGLFQIANKKLMSNELPSLLQLFNIKTLQVLILNEFYELQNKNLEWIKNCPLKKLSLRRCFRITNDIYSTIQEIKTLQDIDITATNIEESKLRQRVENGLNNSLFEKVLKITNHFLDPEEINPNNVLVLKEISRVANCYHIPQLQHAFNKKFPMNFRQIESITLEGARVRQQTQYYLLQLLKAFPEMEILKMVDCEWKHSLITNSVYKFNQFPYIQGLKRLKQLTLVKSGLMDLTKTNINQYSFLRKLDISHNYSLKKIEKLSLGQLRDLDISHTAVQAFDLQPQDLKRLQKLNIQMTYLSQIPSKLLQFNYLRIIISDRTFSKQTNQQHQLRKWPIQGKDKKTILYLSDIVRVARQERQATGKRQKQCNEDTAYLQEDIFANCYIVITSQWKQELKKWNEPCCHCLLDYQIFKVEEDIKGVQPHNWLKDFNNKLNAEKEGKRLNVLLPTNDK